MRTYLLALYALVLLALATPAMATDGVLEINHTCATSTGCFSGDTAGYPVRIDGSAGHSYTLTSDLAVTDVNTEVITVIASDVSIDLNGFEILGPVTCTGAGPTLSCSGFGGGSGIDASQGRSVSVRNGSVKGAGQYGVRVGRHGEVRNLRIRWSGIDGIVAGHGSIVSDNVSIQNAVNGIETGGGAVVSGNASRENGNDGIRVGGHGCLVRGNTSSLNGDDGVDSYGEALIHDNSLTENADYGLDADTPISGRVNGFRGNFLEGNMTGEVIPSVLFQDLGGNYF